jgi:hypothetical protein
MKNEETTPWIQILGFLFLLILGMILPFWIEYRSRTNPVPDPASSAMRAPTLEDREAHYCPACGSKLTLPAWQTKTQRAQIPTPSLSLKSLDESSPNFSEKRRE